MSSDVEEVTLRALIKIETMGDSQGQQTAIKTVCAPTELLARPQAAFFVLLHKHQGMAAATRARATGQEQTRGI